MPLAVEGPAEQAPLPQTPDRLPPGQLLEGSELAFQLPLPRDMKVEARFVDWVKAQGAVPLPALIEYVKDRVAVRHVEMLERRVVFPAVRVKGGDGRVLRIELLQGDYQTDMLVKDLTPPPAVPGLSEEERWKKAGMTQSGQLIDQQNLE